MRCDLVDIGDGKQQCRRDACRRVVAWVGPISLTCRADPGWGDKLGKRIESATGIKTEDCKGCVERRAFVNRVGEIATSLFTRTKDPGLG